MYKENQPLFEKGWHAANNLLVSCGTIVVNRRGEILLCHVTGADCWDLPKGVQEVGESALDAAKRELQEETGLVFNDEMFEEIGCFPFSREKRLHLFRVYAPHELDSLGHLICTSHFTHHVTGEPTPEMDGFCWAARHELAELCAPNLAERLLSLSW